MKVNDYQSKLWNKQWLSINIYELSISFNQITWTNNDLQSTYMKSQCFQSIYMENFDLQQTYVKNNEFQSIYLEKHWFPINIYEKKKSINIYEITQSIYQTYENNVTCGSRSLDHHVSLKCTNWVYISNSPICGFWKNH